MGTLGEAIFIIILIVYFFFTQVWNFIVIILIIAVNLLCRNLNSINHIWKTKLFALSSTVLAKKM